MRKAALDVPAHLAGYSFKKKGRPWYEAEFACASGLVIFLQQVYYLLIADPPRPGRSPQGWSWGSAPGSPPAVALTWSHIKSLEGH